MVTRNIIIYLSSSTSLRRMKIGQILFNISPFYWTNTAFRRLNPCWAGCGLLAATTLAERRVWERLQKSEDTLHPRVTLLVVSYSVALTHDSTFLIVTRTSGHVTHTFWLFSLTYLWFWLTEVWVGLTDSWPAVTDSWLGITDTWFGLTETWLGLTDSWLDVLNRHSYQVTRDSGLLVTNAGRLVTRTQPWSEELYFNSKFWTQTTTVVLL